ncbi:MAG TPA: KTSC domain-containing protein [Candidatus Binataceae bacterium]|nr:KTSC domain-containing protein [Candidatus Binataceae bacterium]
MYSQSATSVEDRFVNAVRSALDSAPDWSAEPVPTVFCKVADQIEIVDFTDSTHLSRAAYDFRHSELTVLMTSGECLRIAPLPVGYWDGLLSATSKGKFLFRRILPRFKVVRRGWLSRMRDQIKSHRPFS